ncbi:ABC transporter ATP-binding protein [Parendozoicomonas sp. Alg238-R29]|uniref:ABC transporter ATP-binding protein n=1 Tax=Parendozoicomonas sp. Alg238-R29 TaxID=2993446 RepID=UPI00248DE6D9|nr:ABC transporter ATP-binding protein [Parendozoicomonas sp. Alg238-R29]
MSRLSIQKLRKSWGDPPAADDIDFTVESGEFVALLGPSGCGKSTTLRMIAGLEAPDSGHIYLNDKEITHLSPGKRDLAMVFQSYALFPHLSVRENILFGLQVRKVSKEEQKRRLNFVIELVDLGSHLHKKPGQLSGGQCQRVALARAVISEARLCLMDEPLSNLDAKLRAEMRSELRALQQRLGMTVLYVTHDQTEAMSMADRIILLNRGRIEQIGRPEELYNQPATTFAAQFIGAPPMNLIRIENRVLGVRPEHIQLVQPGMGLKSSHRAVVKGCDYLGADTLIQLQLDEHSLQLRITGHQKLQPGSSLEISWAEQDQHSFCRTSGQRVAADALQEQHIEYTKKETHYAA